MVGGGKEKREIVHASRSPSSTREVVAVGKKEGGEGKNGRRSPIP